MTVWQSVQFLTLSVGPSCSKLRSRRAHLPVPSMREGQAWLPSPFRWEGQGLQRVEVNLHAMTAGAAPQGRRTHDPSHMSLLFKGDPDLLLPGLLGTLWRCPRPGRLMRADTIM